MLRKVISALAVAVSIFALSGCATAGGARASQEPLVDAASAVLLSEKELKNAFGYGNENPFVAAGGSLLPQAYDYVVVKLTIASSEKATVEMLQTDVTDKDGNNKAKLYDLKTFADYACAIGMSQNDQYADRRRTTIEWNYLPDRIFDIGPGKREYILVFMGKHALPNDLEAYVHFKVGDRQYEFSLPVPNAED